jgi:hypothetical protein
MLRPVRVTGHSHISPTFPGGACDATSVLLPNAKAAGACGEYAIGEEMQLKHGEECKNIATPGYVCTASECNNGILTAGWCEGNLPWLWITIDNVGARYFLGTEYILPVVDSESLSLLVHFEVVHHLRSSVFHLCYSPASCSAYELVANAASAGDCGETLVSRETCTNEPEPGYVCRESSCLDGVLTPGFCEGIDC